MALESATYISDLNPANPDGGDQKSTLDDHLRMMKQVELNTWPNVTGAVTASHTELNYVDGVTSAIQTQLDAKAPLASPALTGTPTAPTAAPGTNNTQIATTAFVVAQAFTSSLPDQTGNSGKFATTNGSSASWSLVPLTSGVSGTLPVANGGTGVTTSTGTGSVVLSTGPTITLANATGLPLATGVSGTLSVANGGTGVGTITGLVKGNGASAFTQASAGTDYVSPSGSETLTNKTIEAGTFTNGYTEESVTANTGSAYTIDLANGSLQILTLTANCTFTFPTATAGKGFTLLLKQDATGSRTVTWDAAVKWPSSTAPTITSTASKADKFTFFADGTNWIGSTAGQNYL